MSDAFTKKALAVMGDGFGTVHFTQESPEHGVKVDVEILGVPRGTYGIHIHDSEGHFNPLGRTHGGRVGLNRHAGDIGNVKSNASKRIVDTFRIRDVSLYEGDPLFIGGRDVVLHAGRDDLGLGSSPQSKTTGNSGPHLMMGQIMMQR